MTVKLVWAAAALCAYEYGDFGTKSSPEKVSFANIKFRKVKLNLWFDEIVRLKKILKKVF